MSVSVEDKYKKKAEPPYAQLIYEFFRHHGDPRRRVPLRAIYDYFRENTTKCSKDGKSWQKSIGYCQTLEAVMKDFW